MLTIVTDVIEGRYKGIFSWFLTYFLYWSSDQTGAWFPGGEGGTSRKLGGVCGLLSKTFTLFWTKICDFPTPFTMYGLSKSSILYLCYVACKVALNVIYEGLMLIVLSIHHDNWFSPCIISYHTRGHTGKSILWSSIVEKNKNELKVNDSAW